MRQLSSHSMISYVIVLVCRNLGFLLNIGIFGEAFDRLPCPFAMLYMCPKVVFAATLVDAVTLIGPRMNASATIGCKGRTSASSLYIMRAQYYNYDILTRTGSLKRHLMR